MDNQNYNPYGPPKSNKRKRGDRFQEDETYALIRTRMLAFQCNKKDSWEFITASMQQNGFHRTNKQLQDKWNNLTTQYNKMAKSGHYDPNVFPYYEIMKEVFGTRGKSPSSNPPTSNNADISKIPMTLSTEDDRKEDPLLDFLYPELSLLEQDPPISVEFESVPMSTSPCSFDSNENFPQMDTVKKDEKKVDSSSNVEPETEAEEVSRMSSPSLPAVGKGNCGKRPRLTGHDTESKLRNILEQRVNEMLETKFRHDEEKKIQLVLHAKTVFVFSKEESDSTDDEEEMSQIVMQSQE